MESDWLPAITMAVITMLCMWTLVAVYAPESQEPVDVSGLVKAVEALGEAELSETQIALITEKIISEFPEIESADNALLNEFLESEFSVQYSDIEDAATEYSFEELFDDDFEVVIDYLKTLLAEGEELDESSVEIGTWDFEDLIDFEDLEDVIEDVDVEVTQLGLGEDEDKSAIVTFEIEVQYRLEEGVNTKFNKDIVVVYTVLFDEGDLTDEDVELVSII